MRTLHRFLALCALSLFGCGSAAPVVDLAQHYAAEYQLVPTTDGAAVGAFSVRGLGFAGNGRAYAKFVHGTTVLYQADIEVAGCAGLELVATDSTLRLDRVSASVAAGIWPAMACERAPKTSPAVPRTTLCKIDRADPRPCPMPKLPPITEPPPPPPPPPPGKDVL